jgi:PAS domain S-box-containing protein
MVDVIRDRIGDGAFSANTADVRVGAMTTAPGWPALFRSAFRQSRNAMVLLDSTRHIVEVNRAFLQLSGYKRADLVGELTYQFVAGGPVNTPKEWAAQLAKVEFEGDVGLICADGTVVLSHWGATVARITGQRLVLVVMMSRSRWGGRFRRTHSLDAEPGELSDREREIVHLVALGRSGPEIAEELGIAHDTVRTHVRNAMEKLGARSRAHMVAKAIGEGHALAR